MAGVKVRVAGFKGLNNAAKNRVANALNAAITKELAKVGAGAAGVFGDGSVKGKQALGAKIGGGG